MMKRTESVKPQRSAIVSRRSLLQASASGTAAALGARMTRGAAQDASPIASPEPAPGGGPVGRRCHLDSGRRAICVRWLLDSRTAITEGTDAASVGITVYSVDGATGAVTLVQTVQSDNPFFLSIDPGQSFLYAVNVIRDYNGGTTGSVEAYARDPATGMLTFVNRVSSGGAVAAQPAVDPSGRWLVVANYNGANFTVLPINDDGSLGEVVSEVTQEGSGPNEARAGHVAPPCGCL